MGPSPRFAIAAAAACVALGTAGVAVAGTVAGDPDHQFSDDGRTDIDFDDGSDIARDLVAVGALGKVVAVGESTPDGSTDSDFALIRLEPEGDRDTDFAGDGQQTTDFRGDDDDGNAVALAPDGKLVVAGTADASPPSSRQFFAVARYKPNGRLDRSFSGDGLVTTRLKNSEQDEGEDVVVSGNGKITVAGETEPNSGGTRFALTRYNPDGSLDQGFSGDGRVTTAIPGGIGQDTAFALAADGGKVVVAGVSDQGATTGDDYALARYKKNGSLDPTFGGDGRVTTDVLDDDQANDLVIQPNGRYVAAGRSFAGAEADYSIARYLINGEPDDSFHNDGMNTVSLTTGAGERINGLAAQANGKILAAGRAGGTGPADGDFVLMRFLFGGDLETGFGFGGDAAITDFFGTSDEANAVTIAPFTPPTTTKRMARGDTGPEVRAVLAGSTNPPAFVGVAPNFALARYHIGN